MTGAAGFPLPHPSVVHRWPAPGAEAMQASFAAPIEAGAHADTLPALSTERNWM